MWKCSLICTWTLYGTKCFDRSPLPNQLISVQINLFHRMFSNPQKAALTKWDGRVTGTFNLWPHNTKQNNVESKLRFMLNLNIRRRDRWMVWKQTAFSLDCCLCGGTSSYQVNRTVWIAINVLGRLLKIITKSSSIDVCQSLLEVKRNVQFVCLIQDTLYVTLNPSVFTFVLLSMRDLSEN